MNYNARLFWTLNIFYWLLHYTIQGTTSPIFLAFKLDYRVMLIASFIFWIMLITGFYRFVHQKLAFGDKSLSFTAIQILMSAVVMALIDIFCRFFINASFFAFDLVSPENMASNSVFARIYTDKEGSDLRLIQEQFSVNGQWVKFMVYVIWVTAYNFYHMALNFRRGMFEKLAAENRAKDLELINLRSQLNPHFLFNALNSIHALAMMKKDTASDAVLLLSDLMRYTLNYEKRDVVPLSEEMEVVEKYLQLEKIRFGKKLTTKLTIADNSLDVKIPPIVVQTLVENAIKHGLQGASNGVFITINSQVTDGFLTIHIVNSGQLKKETLPNENRDKLAVASIPRNDNEMKNSGIGVENTRRRLQMIYGEKARFDLENLNETEVIATLKLPII